LTQGQQLIDIDDYGIPSFVEGKKSEGLQKDAVKFAERIMLYVDDYDARYAEYRKQTLTVKKLKISQYAYHWMEGRKQQFIIVNAESKSDAEAIFKEYLEKQQEEDIPTVIESKKLNSANKIIDLNKLFL